MHTRVRFWVTPEAARALSQAAGQRGTDRTRYLHDVVRNILRDHAPQADPDELLPVPARMPEPYRLNPNPALGYKGRWSRWTRVGFVADARLPMLLTSIATETGDVTLSSLLRRYLNEQLRSDLGATVPMPNPAQGSIFAKAVHQ